MVEQRDSVEDLSKLGRVLRVQQCVEMPDDLDAAIAQVVSGRTGVSANGILMAVPDSTWGAWAQDIADAYSTTASGRRAYADFWRPYSLFYLPSNLPKIQQVLFRLHAMTGLPETLVVADIGCGPGTMGLGIIDYYDKWAMVSGRPTEVSLVAVDSCAENLDALRGILEVWGRRTSLRCSTHLETICRDAPSAQDLPSDLLGACDLVVIGNVLNDFEMQSQEASQFVLSLLPLLTNEGYLVLIEPADEVSARHLAGHVSCLRSSGGLKSVIPCPMGCSEYPEHCECWCTWCLPWLKSPGVRHLERRGLVKRKNELKFSHFVMSKHEHLSVSTGVCGATRIGDIGRHLRERVTVCGNVIRVDHRLGETVLSLCDGSCARPDQVKIRLLSESVNRANQELEYAVPGDHAQIHGAAVAKSARDGALTVFVRGDTVAQVGSTYVVRGDVHGI